MHGLAIESVIKNKITQRTGHNEASPIPGMNHPRRLRSLLEFGPTLCHQRASVAMFAQGRTHEAGKTSIHVAKDWVIRPFEMNREMECVARYVQDLAQTLVISATILLAQNSATLACASLQADRAAKCSLISIHSPGQRRSHVAHAVLATTHVLFPSAAPPPSLPP